jgi:hypothetical protein
MTRGIGNASKKRFYNLGTLFMFPIVPQTLKNVNNLFIYFTTCLIFRLSAYCIVFARKEMKDEN